MPRKKRERLDPASFLLAEKSPEDIAAALEDKRRDELIELIVALVRPEHLLTASQIAQRCQVPKEEVLADMRAGRFRDAVFGTGFLSRSARGSSHKVTRAAVLSWMRTWFVPVQPPNPIPTKKKAASENGVAGEKPEQMRAQFGQHLVADERRGPGGDS